MRKKPTLYRMFDAGGRLLYVGCTDLFMDRVDHHAGAKDWWTDVDAIRPQHFATSDEAFVAEADAIATEKPLHNVQRPRPDLIRERRSAMPPPTGPRIPMGPIRDALLRAGLDGLDDLADLAGIGRATAYRTFRTNEGVSIATVAKIAPALGFTSTETEALIQAERQHRNEHRQAA